MTALVLGSVALATVGAIDMARLSNAHRDMQKALDSAVVAALRDNAMERGQEDTLRRTFAANTDHGTVTDIAVQNTDDFARVAATAGGTVDTLILERSGITTPYLSVNSTAERKKTVSQIRFKSATASGYWNKTIRIMGERDDGSKEQLGRVVYASGRITAQESAGWVDMAGFRSVYLTMTIDMDRSILDSHCPRTCPSKFRSDDPAYSHRIYIDGVRLARGVSVDLIEKTPCQGRVKHQWEDGGGSSPDFSYFLEGTCGIALDEPIRITR